MDKAASISVSGAALRSTRALGIAQMANRQLKPEELVLANSLLSEIRAKLEELSCGDKELLFAYRRKVFNLDNS